MSRRPPNTVIDPDYLFNEQYEYTGIGQIIADKYYEACAKDRGTQKGKPGAGFAERYKVRLCYHNSSITKEEILVNALRQTDLPSGQGACGINIPLTPNTFVNIHRNKTSKQYYITSVMTSPNCSFDPQNEELQGCGPKSGFVAGLNWIKVPTTHIKEDKSGTGNETGAGAPCVFSLQDKLQDDDRKLSIAVPLACKTVNIGGINTEIKNLIKSLEKAKKDLFGPGSFVADSQEWIAKRQEDLNKASVAISQFIQWLIEEQIKKRVEDKVNSIINETSKLLYLNQRFKLREETANALDLIACFFNKILDNLQNLIAQFLNQIIDRYINAPLCAIEAFLSDLIGGLLNQIINGVNSILSSISGLIGSAVDVAETVIDTLIDILDFLTCDTQNICPEVTEWNFLDGVTTSQAPNLDLKKIFDGAKKVKENAKNVVTGGEAILIQTSEDIANTVLNFPNSIENILQSCNIGPILCGPPNVVFWGGSGGGASGNAIISAAGDILGVDIITPGSYGRKPFVTFEDACGKGVGAYGEVIMNDNGGVDRVVIFDPGDGYLPQPDGSQGGMERTWANPEDTTVKNNDGTWDVPYPPGTTFTVSTGDVVTYPGQPPFTVDEDGTLTAPPLAEGTIPGSEPSNSDGTYPVVIGITDVIIEDGGFGYNPGDQIVISPDNGAEFEPTYGPFGNLQSIKIINGGYGFKEYPEISIDTKTGYNARIIPVFQKVDPPQVPDQRQIIQVIDCVGKI